MKEQSSWTGESVSVQNTLVPVEGVVVDRHVTLLGDNGMWDSAFLRRRD